MIKSGLWNHLCNFSPKTHQVVLVGHANGDSRQWPHGNLQSGNFGPVNPSVTSSRLTPSVTSSETQSISNEVPTLSRRTTSLRQYFHKNVSNAKHHHDVTKPDVQAVPGILPYYDLRGNLLSLAARGQFHQRFTSSFCSCSSQKSKNTLMAWLSFLKIALLGSARVKVSRNHVVKRSVAFGHKQVWRFL